MTLTPDQRRALVDALENPDCEYCSKDLGGMVSYGVLARSHDYRKVWLTCVGKMLAQEIRRSERRAEVLRSVEWVVDEYDNEYGDNWERDGHATDCDLAACLNS